MNYESLGQDFRREYGALSHFGFCDFRPTFEGYLVNLAVEIGRSETRDATLTDAWRQFRRMLNWTLRHKQQFAVGDKIQIIVGWTLDVRKTGREILKGGIDISALDHVPKDMTFKEFTEMGGSGCELPGWDLGVFK